MIFIDSNIPMYLVGADHPNKGRAEKLVASAIERREYLVTSAEAFQEILHRYTAIRRRDAIGSAWEILAEIADETFPVQIEDVERARDLIGEVDGLSARDALHAAVMRRHDVRRILSFDTRFDLLDDVLRLG
ncbi:MAG: type II toxin-antitoxin system VapC family toxin [Acidobacteriota bacterium]